MAFMFKSCFVSPKPLEDSCGTGIVIEDGAGVIADEEALGESLEAFWKKTGIAPAVITVYNEQWKASYKDLERYAFSAYVNMYNSDEKHWLIVYSSDLATDFEDWYFEGMRRDETDNILTYKVTEKFNEIVNQCLTARSRYTMKEAFSEGFDYVTEKSMKVSVNKQLLFFMLLHSFVGLGIPLFILITILKDEKDPDGKLKANATLCPSATETLMEDTCDYCDGVYLHGIHTSCPHCGAKIKAKSGGVGYRLNENPNMKTG